MNKLSPWIRMVVSSSVVAALFGMASAAPAETTLRVQWTRASVFLEGREMKATMTVQFAPGRRRAEVDYWYEEPGDTNHLWPASEIEIARLDQSTVWELNAEKKTFQVRGFDDLRRDVEEHQRMSDEVKNPKDTPWQNGLPAGIAITRSEEHRQIAGFDCVLVRAIWSERIDDPMIPGGKVAHTLEAWLGQGVPGEGEWSEFRGRLRNSVGIDPSLPVHATMPFKFAGFQQSVVLGAILDQYGGFPMRCVYVERPSRKKKEWEKVPIMGDTFEVVEVKPGAGIESAYDVPADFELTR